MNNFSNHERNISLVFLDLGEFCPIQTEQRYVQVLGPDKRILEKGIQHMDRPRLSLVGVPVATFPGKYLILRSSEMGFPAFSGQVRVYNVVLLFNLGV